MLPDREQQRLNMYRAAPLETLLAVLLRQFRRLLLRHGLALNDAMEAEIALTLVRREPPDGMRARLATALAALVEESEAVLGGLGLTFAQSLAMPVSELPGWDSTADFLALAEQKANAELRISTGSALLVLLGEARFAGHLNTVLAHAKASGQPDLDSIVAERVLAHCQTNTGK